MRDSEATEVVGNAMNEELVFAGFGGQGILLGGRMLAQAAMCDGLNATWFPSYGPEMRGGTCNCLVAYSDDEIGSPIFGSFDAALIMNFPSLEKFGPMVRPGGLMMVNSSLVEIKDPRTDVQIAGLLHRAIETAFDTADAGTVSRKYKTVVGSCSWISSSKARRTITERVSHLPTTASRLFLKQSRAASLSSNDTYKPERVSQGSDNSGWRSQDSRPSVTASSMRFIL